MDFAADAVFDLIAPQPRAAPARPAPTDASDPSFDKHLEAATAEAPDEPDAKPVENAKADEAPESEPTDESAVATTISAAPPTEPPAPAHIIQIVVAPAEMAPPSNTEASAPPPAAPIEAAPAESARAPQPPKPPQPSAPIEASNESVEAKSDANRAEAKADAPHVKGAPAESTAPDKSAAPAAPTTDVSAEATANTQTEAALPLSSAPAVPAEAAVAMSSIAKSGATDSSIAPIAQRSGKVEVARGIKSSEAPEGKAETPSASTQNSAAKSAPTPAAAKEGTTANAPAPVETIDASAPTTQQGANALTQPAAQTQHAASVEQTNAARAAPAAVQVAREIVRRFDGENTRFELRLDPPELGRVEVRLDVSRDNRVTAVIAADSPQALTELARHARDLEQMLQSSGLELADNGLSFDLRQGGEGSADAEEGGATSARAGAASEEALQQQNTAARPLGYERWRGVRVDMMV